LAALMAAVKRYPLTSRQRVFFEYVMLEDVNDTTDDAHRLARLLRGVKAKVNLIPFNDWEGANFRRPPLARILAFQSILLDAGITGTVTARAEFSDRQMIRRAARVSPGAKLVVTGCWAQTSPGEVAAMGVVDLVVGNGDKARLPDLLDRVVAGKTYVSDIARARTVEVAPVARLHGRCRAFLNVQDGCQHRCAF